MISLQVIPGDMIEEATLVFTDGALFLSIPFVRKSPSSILEKFYRVDICLTFNSHECIHDELTLDRRLFFSTWFSRNGDLALELCRISQLPVVEEPIVLSDRVPFSFDSSILELMPKPILPH